VCTFFLSQQKWITTFLLETIFESEERMIQKRAFQNQKFIVFCSMKSGGG